MNKKLFIERYCLFILFSILFIVLQVSCGTDPKDVTNVYVEQSLTPKITVESEEEFPQNNCGGGKSSQTLGSQARVNQSITLGSRATTGAGAEVEIPTSIKLKLEGEIERSYEQTFGMENSRLDQIEMSADPGTEVIYVITWEQHKYTSMISYEAGGKTYRTNYTYTLRVPKLTDSHPGTHCPTCYISGVVYNRDDNQPIANVAIVYIAADGSGYGDNVLAYTDPGGRFETTCPKISYQHYPIRLSVAGIVPGCGVNYQTENYVHIDERKENLVIYVTKSTVELACSSQ
jgi:hypothetical protein